MSSAEPYDPKGLMKDAFAIEGIAAPECRSIFLDWALGLPTGRDTQKEVRALLARHAPHQDADHPMMQTLQAALKPAASPRRRGGRQTRVANNPEAG